MITTIIIRSSMKFMMILSPVGWVDHPRPDRSSCRSLCCCRRCRCRLTYQHLAMLDDMVAWTTSIGGELYNNKESHLSHLPQRPLSQCSQSRDLHQTCTIPGTDENINPPKTLKARTISQPHIPESLVLALLTVIPHWNSLYFPRNLVRDSSSRQSLRLTFQF